MTTLETATHGRTGWLGWSMAMISTVSFSVAPPVAKGAIGAGIDPTALLLIRFLIASLLLTVTVILANPKLLKIDRRGFVVAAGIGLANAIGILAFFWSLTRLTSSLASMIFSLQPLVVLGLLALRGERFTARNHVRVLLGLTGVYLLIGPGRQVDLAGVLMVVVALLAFSIQLVMTQWFMKGYDPRTVTMYVVIAMTAVIFAWWVVDGGVLQDPGPSGWLAILVLALVSTYIARLTLFIGVRGLGGGQIALLSPVETLLSVTWAFLFLGERLAVPQLIGGALVLVSALLAVRRIRLAGARPPWRLLSRL